MPAPLKRLVRVSAQLRETINLVQALFAGRNAQSQAIDASAFEVLKLMRLETRLHGKADSLPYGDQRRIAR
jgi:ABC-type branched-subunit amino acid transport system ATPase component